MSGDDLERAIAALREQGERPAPQARLTKSRILRELRPRAGRRRVMWLVPIAALLAGSTVLAATGRLPGAYHAAARALGFEASTPLVARPPAPDSRTVAPRPASTESSPPVAPAATTPAPAQEPTPDGEAATSGAGASASPTPTVRRGATRPEPKERAAHAATTSTAEPSPAPPSSQAANADDDPALALYRRARQLHFVEQKPAAALAAWDAYLAADPRGPLAIDARYGRALCLVRLGRSEEARAALEPFATGKYGSYRQNEARALLDALK